MRGFNPRQVLLLVVSTFLLAATVAAIYFSPSGDATLRHILVSEGTLTPSFAKATTSYTASVANEVEEMSVTGVINNAQATLLINGAYAQSTVAVTGSLSVGENPFVLAVTAEDNTSTSTYTVTVTRAP